MKVPPRQAEIEEKWDSFTKKNYAEAEAKAKQALARLASAIGTEALYE